MQIGLFVWFMVYGISFAFNHSSEVVGITCRATVTLCRQPTDRHTHRPSTVCIYVNVIYMYCAIPGYTIMFLFFCKGK